MKTNFLYLLLLLMVFSAGCKKDRDAIFEQSPDERLNEVLQADQAALVGAANGWKATLVANTGATYNFFFKFNNANRVTMFSDFDSTTAGTPRESSYRLKAQQQPSLLFDTYSYIHILADPTSSVNGGAPGEGLQIDFEFSIDSVANDFIELTGKKNSTKMTLVRATQQEATEWETRLWARSFVFFNIYNMPTYFKRLVVGGQQFDIQVDEFSRTMAFTWVDANGNIRSFATGYFHTATGIRLATTLTVGTQSINGFTNISWNPTTRVVNVSVNNTATTIISAAAPVKVDVAAPQRWWQYAFNVDSYWIGFGFTVNGVFDAYGVTSIADYFLFWPAYSVSGGITYDLLGYVANNSIGYGSAFRPPTFTTDGRIIFTNLGTLGTVPAAATNALVNTRTKMLDPDGYYLVQISEGVYDMVSAKDATAWIRWYF